MIEVSVSLRHSDSNNLNDLVIKVSGESYEEIEKSIREFRDSYNMRRRSAIPPETLLIDWYICDREEQASLIHAIDFEASIAQQDDFEPTMR